MRIRALLIALAFMLAGCKDPYGASAKAGADIAKSISQGLATVQTLAQQSAITPAEALKVAGYLDFVNKADETFLACVADVHSAGANSPRTYSTCAQIFATALNSPATLALIQVQNVQASQTIQAIIGGFATGLTGLQVALGGA